MLKIPQEFIARRPTPISVWLPDQKGRRVYLNLSKIARAIEVDTSYVSRIMDGSRTPSLKTMMRLADTLNLTSEQLFELIQLKRVML